jgi:hypothetical protein
MGEFHYIGTAALIGKGQAAILAAVTESAEDLVGKAMAATPVGETGNLRAGLHVDSVQAGGNTVKATVATGGEADEYAIPIHEGSAPHEIRAKNGGFLAWPGGAHPVKVVHHPGNKPYKFLEGPLLANRGLYLLAMQRAAAGQF